MIGPCLGIVDIIVSALEELADDFVDLVLDKHSDVVEDDLFFLGHVSDRFQSGSLNFILLNYAALINELLYLLELTFYKNNWFKEFFFICLDD